ncbi:hypothetical protein FJTKL_02133 [Diaporthe vaccinii]|uniref:F-box domain-containing protein n=1 Tax=Diaporthe vaccinii TaxID=105482 RepID=A0ABR4DYT2_9PEZI
MAGFPIRHRSSTASPKNSQACFTRLPQEILSLIFSCCHTSDLRVLRETCRLVERPASAILFHRVAISPLRRHLSILRLIADSERLTGHVREIVWYDLTINNEILKPQETDHDDVRQILQNCWKNDLCWLPRAPRGSEGSKCADYDDSIRNTMNRELLPLLSHMKGICSVKLEPMRHTQVVTLQDEVWCYPLTAQTILSRMSMGSFDKLFYRPFVIFWQLINTLNKPIQKLICVEGVLTSLPEQLLGGRLDSTGLTDIELTLQDPLWQPTLGEDNLDDDEMDDYEMKGNERLSDVVTSVEKLIRKASRLQSLTLSLSGDEGGDHYDDTWRWDKQSAYLPETGRAAQEEYISLLVKKERRLRQLKPKHRAAHGAVMYIDHGPIREAYSPLFCLEWQDLRYLHLRQVPISQEDLILFIERHKASLRTIILENYSIPFRTIEDMRNITELQLDKLQISLDAECTGLFTSPRLLRDYVNKAICLPRHVDMDTNTVTHTMVWPLQEDFKTGLNPNLARVWVDDNIWFLDDRQDITIEVQSEENDNTRDEAETYHSSGLAVSLRDSHGCLLDRMRNPWWKMARLSLEPDAPVFYWKVPPGEIGGKPTAVWNFKHRSGAVALGTEPLAYFGDWNEAAGDRALPTPHSAEFDNFVQKGNSCILCDLNRASCARAKWGCMWELRLEQTDLPKRAQKWCPTPFQEQQAIGLAAQECEDEKTAESKDHNAWANLKQETKDVLKKFCREMKIIAPDDMEYWAGLWQEVNSVTESLCTDERAFLREESSTRSGHRRDANYTNPKAMMKLQQQVGYLTAQVDDYHGTEEMEEVKVESEIDSEVSSPDACFSVWEQFRRQAPRWKWGDIGKDHIKVFYWQTSAAEGWPTEVWRFVIRDGTVTYGLRPPARWDATAGDTAEPTPYGPAISEAIRHYESQWRKPQSSCNIHCWRCRCLEALGNALDPLENMTEEELQKKLPPSAVLYEPDVVKRTK